MKTLVLRFVGHSDDNLTFNDTLLYLIIIKVYITTAMTNGNNQKCSEKENVSRLRLQDPGPHPLPLLPVFRIIPSSVGGGGKERLIKSTSNLKCMKIYLCHLESSHGASSEEYVPSRHESSSDESEEELPVSGEYLLSFIFAQMSLVCASKLGVN